MYSDAWVAARNGWPVLIQGGTNQPTGWAISPSTTQTRSPGELPEQPRAVPEQERPRLRAHQTERRCEQIGLRGGVPAIGAVDRPQRAGDQHRLGGATEEVVGPATPRCGQDDPERGEQPPTQPMPSAATPRA